MAYRLDALTKMDSSGGGCCSCSIAIPCSDFQHDLRQSISAANSPPQLWKSRLPESLFAKRAITLGQQKNSKISPHFKKNTLSRDLPWDLSRAWLATSFALSQLHPPDTEIRIAKPWPTYQANGLAPCQTSLSQVTAVPRGKSVRARRPTTLDRYAGGRPKPGRTTRTL